MNGLTYKQELFAKYYAESGEGTKSALRAGYAERGADVQASRLLADAKIQDVIEEHKADAAAENRITRGKIVRRLETLAFGDRTQLVETKVRACRDCHSEETRRTLEAAKLTASLRTPNPDCKVCEGEGIKFVSMKATADIPKELRCLITGYTQTKDGIKMHTVDPIQAQLLLGKMTGFLIERKEIAGPNGGPIQLSTEDKPPSLMTDEELNAQWRLNQLRKSAKGVLEGVYLELPAPTDESNGDKS